jgi:hypothetical protein
LIEIGLSIHKNAVSRNDVDQIFGLFAKAIQTALDDRFQFRCAGALQLANVEKGITFEFTASTTGQILDANLHDNRIIEVSEWLNDPLGLHAHDFANRRHGLFQPRFDAHLQRHR